LAFETRIAFRNEGSYTFVKSQLWKIFVHIAYLDDSQPLDKLAMCGAVVMPHGTFGWAERIHSIAVQQVFAPNEIEEKFQEFHSRELFKGEGAFQGIDETKRFQAITVLLAAMREYRLPFFYAAVDRVKFDKHPLSQGLFETASPVVAAFKLCLLGIEDWAFNRHSQKYPQLRGMEPIPKVLDYDDQYLLIADETKDAELKKRLRRSYRLLRSTHLYSRESSNRLWHAHDAMYFGDSTESVGIQLADLCTYFVQRRLLKRDPEHRDKGDEFYQMFSDQIICAKPEPEWSQYRGLLVSHEGDGKKAEAQKPQSS
jgi:hypothetical protein